VKTIIPLAIAAVVITAAAPHAFAQNQATAPSTPAPSASTIGAGSASGSSGTVGTAGSGAAGGTSPSTLGTGGTSTGPAGTSSTIGGAGSAATSDGGKATTSNKVHENPNMLQDQARAKAQDGGTWSKSMTNTKIKEGELDSRTKSMAHEPGGPPAKSTTTQSVPITK
jgi:hypothetical protein